MSADFISTIFGGGKKEHIPKRDDPAINEARRRRRFALAKAAGRSSTILAGPGGVETAENLARSVLGPIKAGG
jgi:hypothetical protein